jgi:hypothetical protein
MNRIPYFLQGALFAPALIGVVFVLKVTCPAMAGEGCFADNFLLPTFMPLEFLYNIFSSYAPLLSRHEPLFILGYWSIVGFVAGLSIDLYKEMKKTPDSFLNSN